MGEDFEICLGEYAMATGCELDAYSYTDKLCPGYLGDILRQGTAVREKLFWITINEYRMRRNELLLHSSI